MTAKKCKENAKMQRVMEIFYILTGTVVTWVCTIVKTHLNYTIKLVHFIVCKL